MNELPKVNTLTAFTYIPDRDVAPTRRIADKNIEIDQDERRRGTERRKRNQKPLIERRVSSDRRSPLFDEKA